LSGSPESCSAAARVLFFQISRRALEGGMCLLWEEENTPARQRYNPFTGRLRPQILERYCQTRQFAWCGDLKILTDERKGGHEQPSEAMFTQGNAIETVLLVKSLEAP
jgi:hypothetical protein